MQPSEVLTGRPVRSGECNCRATNFPYDDAFDVTMEGGGPSERYRGAVGGCLINMRMSNL